MRVLLISANAEQINVLPLPLGLNCVAVATRNAGHDVRFLDLLAEEDIPASLKRAINAYDPEIIGISVRNIDDQAMTPPKFLLEQVKSMIDECRKLSPAPVVLGGAGYSIFPQSALEYLGADMGIQGEGEEPFRLLLKKLEKNRPLAGVAGLYIKGNGLQGPRAFVNELDQLPLPDPDLFTALFPIQTRRGCPMGCSYCSTASIEGTRIRKRSPERVVEWITRLAGRGIRQLYFVDNTFNLPVSYAQQLCREMIRASLRLKWRCILYPLNVEASPVSAMAAAGCVEASIGFESGSERILMSMRKRFTRRDVADTNPPPPRAGYPAHRLPSLGRSRRNPPISRGKPFVCGFP